MPAASNQEQAAIRKRDVSLSAAENVFLESIRAQHPEWVDPKTGECAQCVMYEHELAQGHSGDPGRPPQG